jgi:hypothetical protein
MWRSGESDPPAGVGRAGPSSQMSGQADPSIGVGRAGPPLQGSGEPDPLSQGSGESDPLYRQRWGTASRYMPFNCNVNIPHRIIFYLAADKAHLRLVAAKAVLRLSRQWDHKVPVDVFYLTLRISQVFHWGQCCLAGLCYCSVLY